jgi:hypothetical protein
MTMAAGARVWDSEMFTEDQLVAWENRPDANKTWDALQTYFTEMWLECCQYSQATVKQSCFKDAALAAQEQAAAEEEGEVTAMMFALLQEQHKLQMDAMAEANKRQWIGLVTYSHHIQYSTIMEHAVEHKTLQHGKAAG